MAAVSSLLVFAAVFLFALWIGPAWDHLSGNYIADLSPRLRALGMDEGQIMRAMRWWGLTMAVVLFVVGVILAMMPVALGIVCLLLVAPRKILDGLIMRRRQKLRDQLVRSAVGLANSARAGMAIAQGLETVAADTPNPLGGELQRIVREYHLGRPLAQGLRDVQQRLKLEAFTMFSSALLVCMERGGKITIALERISQGLQELQRLERKVEADNASGRKLAFTLAAFPIFFLIGFTVLDPESMGYLYHTFLGQMILVGVGAIVYLSLQWCLRILTIDF